MTKRKSRYWSKQDKLQIIRETIKKQNRPIDVAKNITTQLDYYPIGQLSIY